MQYKPITHTYTPLPAWCRAKQSNWNGCSLSKCDARSKMILSSLSTSFRVEHWRWRGEPISTQWRFHVSCSFSCWSVEMVLVYCSFLFLLIPVSFLSINTTVVSFFHLNSLHLCILFHLTWTPLDSTRRICLFLVYQRDWLCVILCHRIFLSIVSLSMGLLLLWTCPSLV